MQNIVILKSVSIPIWLWLGQEEMHYYIVTFTYMCKEWNSLK